ncbi:helix-turn-helix domain-containing protein [Streptomyces coerulescens]|uniref:Helix-turn-helix domain-containing protein n=1 Tax=Streptomyces coerulescens TaxID=29304 RepID=A0ABW0CWW1_STRCD
MSVCSGLSTSLPASPRTLRHRVVVGPGVWHGAGRASGVPVLRSPEVLEGSPIGEVAARYGTSRQSLRTWRTRFEQEA